MTTDPTAPTADQPGETETLQYLAWARTWAAAAETSPLESPEVEQRVMDFFHQLCRRVEPAIALEIGAHEASFSLWATRELPGVTSLAFEANPYVHEKYRDEVLAAGVDYRNVAVAPTSGEVELHLPVELGNRVRPLTSRMASLVHHVREVESKTVSVPAVRLDEEPSLAEGSGRIVAWIDVEGANEAVLCSGPDVLRRIDVLYLEVEDEVTWEGQWLDTHTAAHLRRHGLLPVARDTRRPLQYNVVFVRDELAADPQVARQVARLQRFRKRPAPQGQGAGQGAGQGDQQG